MKFYFKLAWRNIWRSPKRTWITASSIAFAVFFACVMQSMQIGSYDRMIENSVRFYTGHLAVQHAEFWEEQVLENTITEEAINSLQLPDQQIEVAAPRLNSFSLASFGDKTKGALINGVDPRQEAAFSKLEDKLVEGSYLSKGSVLIAAGLADFLKMGVGDTLVLISQGYRGINAAGKYPVAGIVRFPIAEINQSAVYMALPDAQYFFGTGPRLTGYSLLLSDASATDAVQQELAGQLSEPWVVRDWQEMMPELLQGIELDYYGGLIMIYILYAVIGFGIFGTFLMMTRERTYEFGIMSAVGMKKSRLQIMVGLEVLMLTFLGVMIGISASLPFLIYLFFNPIQMTGESAAAFESFGYEAIIPFSLDAVIFYDQAVVILIIALVLGLYPLNYIRHLKVINALKE
mgnify:CR=1 FL=1